MELLSDNKRLQQQVSDYRGQLMHTREQLARMGDRCADMEHKLAAKAAGGPGVSEMSGMLADVQQLLGELELSHSEREEAFMRSATLNQIGACRLAHSRMRVCVRRCLACDPVFSCPSSHVCLWCL